MDEFDLRNRLRNKMIRPTTIPQTYEDLLIEHAVAREALRLAFLHHKSLARGLVGMQTQRTIGEAVSQEAGGQTLVKMMDLDMIIGSGGVLSHAPDRRQSALMMIDAYAPEGITILTVDSIFMMPHLGVLSEHHPAAAGEVFERDCLVRIGTCIAPVGGGKTGEPCLRLTGAGLDASVAFGEIKLVPWDPATTPEVSIDPSRGFDVGAGKGKRVVASATSQGSTKLEAGLVGLIVDCRGRPLAIPDDTAARRKMMLDTLVAFGLPRPE